MDTNIPVSYTSMSSARPPDYYVYTDGACSNNGKSSAKAGIGIYFGPDHPLNWSDALPSGPHIKQTNNIAELTAIIHAFSIIQDDLECGKCVAICTDSEYAIKCATTYGRKCNAVGWKDDIPNKGLVRDLYTLYDTHKTQVQLVHIRAHTGQTDVHSVGNENADRLANLAIGVDVRVSTTASANDRKIYLVLMYEKKDEAKRLGAKWDAKRKKWYVLETDKNMRELCDQFGQTQTGLV